MGRKSNYSFERMEREKLKASKKALRQEAKKESMNICQELINKFKDIKGVKGIHLMGHNKEEEIAEIIQEAKKN